MSGNVEKPQTGAGTQASEAVDFVDSEGSDESFNLTLTDTHIKNLESKLSELTAKGEASVSELAQIALTTLGLKITSLDGNAVTLKGEGASGVQKSESFTAEELKSFLEQVLEAYGAADTPENSTTKTFNTEGRFVSTAELPAFIETFLKTVPDNLEGVPIPEDLLKALRSFGGEYRRIGVVRDEVSGEKMVRYGLMGMDKRISHEQALQVLRDYLKTGKKPELPKIPPEELPAYITHIFAEYPEDADFESKPIKDELIVMLRSRGGGFSNARVVRQGGARVVVFGPKVKETTFTHTEAVKSLREFAKKKIERAEKEKKSMPVRPSARKEADPAPAVSSVEDSVGTAPDADLSMEGYRTIEAERHARATQLRKMYGTPTGSASEAATLEPSEPVESPLETEPEVRYPIFKADSPIEPAEDADPWAALEAEHGAPAEAAPVEESLTEPQVPTGLPDDALDAMYPQRLKNRDQLKGIKYEERFATEFNITREELMSIDGYEHLSYAQQKLLFENLAQSIYSSVKEGAKEQHAEKKNVREAELAEKKGYRKYVGKAWSAVHEVFTKDFDIAKTEKELAIDSKNAGFEAHHALLEQLVDSMNAFGPRVHEDIETGELQIDLVQREWVSRTDRDREWVAIQELNHAAHAFAKIPQSWKEEKMGSGAGREGEWSITSRLKERFSSRRKEELAYETAREEFENAKESFVRSLEESEMSEKEILRTLMGIDSRVEQLQFIQTDPEAVEALGSIEDRSVWKEGAKAFLGKSGMGYVALGYVGRTVLTGVLGWAAAPIVSSGIAGVRSWNKTKAELRERDRLARMGVVDTTTEALNIVAAGGEQGMIGKTERLLQEIYATVEARHNTDENSPERDEIERHQQKLLGRLDARVSYIEDKHGLQRINYGSREEALVNHARLLEVLGEAKGLLLAPEAQKNHVLASRLDSYLETREKSIEKNRNSYRRTQILKQVAKSAGFSLAGALLAHLAAPSEAAPLPKGKAAPLPDIARPPRPQMDAPSGTPDVPPPQAPVEGGLPRGVETKPSLRDIELPTDYTIKKGDTLLKIIEKNPFANSTSGDPLTPEETLRMLRSLSSEELKELGIRSGNIDRIYADDTLDLEALRGKMLEHEADVPSNQNTVGPREDQGDYRGPQYERTDPIDTPIRESEVPDPSRYTDGFVNEYPSGDSPTPHSNTPEGVDLITQKKAEILQNYFFKANHLDSNKELWKRVESDFARLYDHKLGLNTEGADPHYKAMERLEDLFIAVKGRPFNMSPMRTETVGKFMHRIFIEIAKHGTDKDFPANLRAILNAVDRSGSST